MEKLIEVDKFGRIIIPIEIRNEYIIKDNDILLLSTVPNGFTLEKSNNKNGYSKLINKIKNIENITKLKFILANDKIIYGSNKYKNSINSNTYKINKKSIKDRKVIKLTNEITINKYIALNIKTKDQKTVNLFIIYSNKNQETLAETVYELLK